MCAQASGIYYADIQRVHSSAGLGIHLGIRVVGSDDFRLFCAGYSCCDCKGAARGSGDAGILELEGPKAVGRKTVRRV